LLFDKVSKKFIQNENHLNCIVLQDNKTYMHYRNKPNFLNTPRYSYYNQYRENFFHQLIILFKPWRLEKELLIHKLNYEQSYRYYVNEKIITILNIQFIDQQKRIQASFEVLN